MQTSKSVGVSSSSEEEQPSQKRPRTDKEEGSGSEDSVAYSGNGNGISPSLKDAGSATQVKTTGFDHDQYNVQLIQRSLIRAKNISLTLRNYNWKTSCVNC